MSYPSPPNRPPGSLGSAPGAAAPRSVMNPLDLAMVAAGALALAFSFLKFYTVALRDNVDLRSVCQAAAQGDCSSVPSKTVSQKQLAAQLQTSGGKVSDSGSAWHGFFGWFGVLLLVIAALIVVARLVAPQAVTNIPDRMLTLVVGALGLVMIVIALFVVPTGDTSGASDKLLDTIFDLGHGYAYWIVLVLAVVFVAVAATRFSADGRGGARSAAGAHAP